MSLMAQAVTQLTALANQQTGSGFFNIPLNSFTHAATGAALAEFADTVPGPDLVDSETIAIRWANESTPPLIGVNGALPLDLNPSYSLLFHFICSKTGATSGDATSLTGAYYNVAVGSLHNADTAVVCVSNALTGAATARTTARLTYTIGTADLVTPPGYFYLTLGPTAALLGTDDFLLHAAFATYTKRIPVTLS